MTTAEFVKKLAAIEEAAKEATPGPWRVNSVGKTRSIQADGIGVATTSCIRPAEGRAEDAIFIALANPSTVLAMSQALRAAVKALETYANGEYQYGVLQEEEMLPLEEWENDKPHGTIARRVLAQAYALMETKGC